MTHNGEQNIKDILMFIDKKHKISDEKFMDIMKVIEEQNKITTIMCTVSAVRASSATSTYEIQRSIFFLFDHAREREIDFDGDRRTTSIIFFCQQPSERVSGNVEYDVIQV